MNLSIHPSSPPATNPDRPPNAPEAPVPSPSPKKPITPPSPEKPVLPNHPEEPAIDPAIDPDIPQKPGPPLSDPDAPHGYLTRDSSHWDIVESKIPG